MGISGRTPRTSSDPGRQVPVPRIPLFLIAALLAVGPVVLIGWYSYHQADQSIRKLVLANNTTAATMAAQAIEHNLRRAVQLAEVFAIQPETIQAVADRDEHALRQRLATLFQIDPLLDRGFVLDTSGVLWSDFPHQPEVIGKNFAYRDYFQGVARNWQPYVSQVYQRQAAPQPLVVSVAVPIRDAAGMVLGVAALQYLLPTITGWASQVVVGTGGYVVVLDREGNVAGHPKLDFAGTPFHQYSTVAQVHQALQEGPLTAQYEDPISRRAMVATFVPATVFDGSRWLIIAQQDRAQAFAPVAALRWQIGLAAAVVMLLAAAAATALARRTRESQQRAQRLRRLALEVTTVEQRERKRLAALLHDNLQQLLVLSGMHLDSAHGRILDPAAAQDVQEARQRILEAIRASRDLTCQLRPPVLYEVGLAPALQWLASQFGQRHLLQVSVDADKDLPPLSDDMKAMLFECVRELLCNVAKHAQTQQACIRVWRQNQQLHLLVEDRGRGFNPAVLAAHTGSTSFGLFSIRERLAAVDGRVTIASSAARGTRIELLVPLAPPPSAPRAPPSSPGCWWSTITPSSARALPICCTPMGGWRWWLKPAMAWRPCRPWKSSTRTWCSWT